MNAMIRLSLTKSGNILKVDIYRNQKQTNGAFGKYNKTGIATKRTLFSCTWKLNKKKANDEFTKASTNLFLFGRRNKSQQEGNKAAKVEKRQILNI